MEKFTLGVDVFPKLNGARCIVYDPGEEYLYVWYGENDIFVYEGKECSLAKVYTDISERLGIELTASLVKGLVDLLICARRVF